MNRLLLIAVCATVLLQGCSVPFANGVTARDVLRTAQSAANIKNMYENSTVKEEAKWRLRSIYGQ